VPRIAISARGARPDDAVDPRFGRAAGFVVFETESGAWSHLTNAASRDLAHGAGLAAAETLSRNHVAVLLTGAVGPKAAQALAAAKIAAHEIDTSGSVRQAVAVYLAGAAG